MPSTNDPSSSAPLTNRSWITVSVIGIVLATFLSDFSHEMCTAVLPLYLSSLGLGPAALRLIEGVSATVLIASLDLCEQPTGKSRIDRGSEKVDIPGNLVYLFQRCIGMRCRQAWASGFQKLHRQCQPPFSGKVNHVRAG